MNSATSRHPMTMIPSRDHDHVAEILAIRACIDPRAPWAIAQQENNGECYWTVAPKAPISTASLSGAPPRQAPPRQSFRGETLARYLHLTPPMPQITLTPVLQLYLRSSHQTATSTLHPIRIGGEARSLAAFLTSGPRDAHTRKLKVASTARILFYAGIYDIKFTRSVALLVAETLRELRNISTSANLVKELSTALLGELMDTFTLSWKSGMTWHLSLDAFMTGEGSQSNSESVVNDALNTPAFIGALFALDVVDMTIIDRCIADLIRQPMSPLCFRALYLLLLNASLAAVQPLSVDSLVKTRRALHAQAWASGAAVRAWLTEIVWIVDTMLADALFRNASRVTASTTAQRPQDGSPSTTLYWDPALRCSSLLNLVNPEVRLLRGPVVARPRREA